MKHGQQHANRGIDHLPDSLHARGFDLMELFPVTAYNVAIAHHPRLSPLPTFGRPNPMGLLIGNSKHFWSIFIAAYRSDPSLQMSPDPIDDYTSRHVHQLAATLDCATSVHLASDTGERLVSMMELARTSGLAHIGPAHLAVHANFGPWFALRAAIVLDQDSMLDGAAVPTNPCTHCEAPCTHAFEAARSMRTDPTIHSVAENWRAWAAVRQVCPVGSESSYPSNQLRYHYTKEREALG